MQKIDVAKFIKEFEVKEGFTQEALEVLFDSLEELNENRGFENVETSFASECESLQGRITRECKNE